MSYNKICHCAYLEDKRGISILQTIFSLTWLFHILTQFIQWHVSVDYKPYWWNAQGDEQYNEVMSLTALFCIVCCFIYMFKKCQSALILSFHDSYTRNLMHFQFSYINSNIKTYYEVKHSSLILVRFFWLSVYLVNLPNVSRRKISFKHLLINFTWERLLLIN